jgi:two-component system chemotaxis response regulator CheB
VHYVISVYNRDMLKSDFYLVAIGSSAGGTEALCDFFDRISSINNAAFVVIPHLKAGYRSVLDQILQKRTKLPVMRVTENMHVQPNFVYLLTEDRMMTIHDGWLRVRPRFPDEIINRAVDIFFESLAEDFGNEAVGVILSGMGDDGVSGVNAISQNGGVILIQEPSSTPYSSMPKEAIRIDHPIEISPPAQLAESLIRFLENKTSINKKSQNVN